MSLLQKAQASAQSAVLDAAVAQGKFEIAADALHDIGNAIVGLGSYLSRIRRSLELQDVKNLSNLAAFFKSQQTAMSGAIGEAKAGAVISMIEGLVEAQKASHDDIQKSMTEQLKLITHVQDILNIQRQYVAGHGSQELKSVNLRGIVHDCLAMQQASLEKRNILVQTEFCEETPSIMGDRTRLMQVVLNILKNSVEAIPVQAEVKTIAIRLSADPSSTTLELKDSGCGFEQAVSERLFERGYTTKTSGTGLGLHNCKAIVEAHGGSITMSSEGPGKGAMTKIEFTRN